VESSTSQITQRISHPPVSPIFLGCTLFHHIDKYLKALDLDKEMLPYGEHTRKRKEQQLRKELKRNYF
jgi:glutamate racemase